MSYPVLPLEVTKGKSPTCWFWVLFCVLCFGFGWLLVLVLVLLLLLLLLHLLPFRPPEAQHHGPPAALGAGRRRIAGSGALGRSPLY